MTTPKGMNEKAVVRGVELRLDTALLGSRRPCRPGSPRS